MPLQQPARPDAKLNQPADAGVQPGHEPLHLADVRLDMGEVAFPLALLQAVQERLAVMWW
jgi:hypothetical protein